MSSLSVTPKSEMSKLSPTVCPVCDTPHWDVFFELLQVPVFCNVLWSDPNAAKNCALGDIRLAFCGNCGFIGNADFDPARLDYTEVYENSLDFSPRFQSYAKALASRLIEDYDLHGKDIIEIGCGKGDFLASLCELGNNRGVGFDPTYIPLPEHSKLGDRITFVQDLYSARYAEYKSDFIACRHTLEHVQKPTTLLKDLRQSLGERLSTSVFFEVPNGLDTFRHMAIWDIIYEHCCFFSPVSLAHAFSRCGFQVFKQSDEFRGQFLCIETTPGEPTNELTTQQNAEVKQLAQDIASFNLSFQQKVAFWENKLEQLAKQGQRAVIWGAGSKGVTFLNTLNNQSAVEHVVDINPRKQGMYIARTGQRIVSPEFLQTNQPDVVIVMNPIYQDEICSTLSSLGVTPEILSVSCA